VESAGSTMRLTFKDLDLKEQAILARLVFGRADTWLDWSSSYEKDRPFYNLLRITAFSIRGIATAMLSLVTSVKGATKPGAALPLVALLLLLPGTLRPQAVQQASPSFREARDIRALGKRHGLVLQGNHSKKSISFALPISRLVTESSLLLRYHLSRNLAAGSELKVFLNGSLAAELKLQPSTEASTSKQDKISLPPELFLAQNALSFELKGVCTPDCRLSPISDTWLALEPSSEVHTAGTLLLLPNRLNLLPAPFVSLGAEGVVDIPFVMDRDVSPSVARAGGIVASWLGVKANSQSLRFSVSLGEVPSGHVILLATQGSQLASSLGINTSSTSVAIRANPQDPYGKMLVLTAPTGTELIAAASALALGRYSPETDASLLGVANLPPARLPYDAPRWLQRSDRVRLAEQSSDFDLQSNGTGSVNLYFRLAPDLYFGSRDVVPFRLHYTSSSLTEGSRASVRLHLNEHFVGSFPIPTDTKVDVHEQVFYLPTARIYPRNTLRVEFAYEHVRLRDSALSGPSARVLRSSELMLHDAPHFTGMPRLDMFANTGFPFTQFADLSRTLVVLPNRPHADELSFFLTTLGFMGAQTGYPGLRVSLAYADAVPVADNKDLLVIGTPERQPLLGKWSDYMLVQPRGKRFQLPPAPQWLGAKSIFSDELKQQRALQRMLNSDAPIDGIVQGFVSPLNKERSVVVITGLPEQGIAQLAADWSSSNNGSQLYGTASIYSGGEFHSFTLKSDQYLLGKLTFRHALEYWARRYYWLSPVLIFSCIWLLAILCNRLLEARAHKRLSTNFVS
jgi:cellulose synthase (UDP-forming)